jgi:hypothetical protein
MTPAAFAALVTARGGAINTANGGIRLGSAAVPRFPLAAHLGKRRISAVTTFGAWPSATLVSAPTGTPLAQGNDTFRAGHVSMYYGGSAAEPGSNTPLRPLGSKAQAPGAPRGNTEPQRQVKHGHVGQAGLVIFCRMN